MMMERAQIVRNVCTIARVVVMDLNARLAKDLKELKMLKMTVLVK